MSKTTAVESPAGGVTRPTYLPPLTTVFSQRGGCQYLFSQTAAETQGTRTLLRTNTGDEYFSSCQPSGWDVSDFTFSPGVCPDDWTYFSMTKTVWSQAYCCAPGYSIQKFDSDEESTSCMSQDETLTTRYYQHKAWVVAWEKADFTSLPYTLPNLDAGGVASWTPPKVTRTSGSSQSEGNKNIGDESSASGTRPLLIILLPVLLFVLIAAGLCSWGAIRHRRKKKLAAQQGIDLRQIAERREAIRNGTENEQVRGNSNVVKPLPVHRYA